MIWLLLVSVVWAFSFGLIKGRLGGVDPSLVAFLRVLLALLVFAPLCRVRAVRPGTMALLAGIGAVQFGLMYVCYIAAFQSLAAYEVAALTIFTPVLVTLIHDALARRIRWAALAAALLAVVGAGIIVVDKPLGSARWTGVLLVQASNACFALGQVAWRRWRLAHPAARDSEIFALLYAGAALITLPFALPAASQVATLTPSQGLVLLYLGIIASGVCFFLWNRGAAQAGAASLAVANNIKIPLSVAFSVWFFGESADLSRLVLGSAAIVAAGLLAEWSGRRKAA